jgi:hypothetical protein
MVDAGTGELQDFIPRHGDEPYAHRARTMNGRARRWGNRVLLAVAPNADPIYKLNSARNSANFISLSDLGESVSVAIQVRFALAIAASGQPLLPFADLTPLISDPSYPAPVLTLRLRRGVDPLAPVTDDVYQLPGFGTDGLNKVQDCAPFDVITARSIGLDIAITQPGATPAQVAGTCLWVEAVATKINEVSARARLPGYFNTFAAPKLIPSSATPVIALPGHAGRAQFVLCNTGNSNAWVSFGYVPVISTSATFVLPAATATNFARYESPVDGFDGPVYVVWDGTGTLSGGLLVTEGTRKSVASVSSIIP